jgi:PHP family Zn ribbon phosphoesterase
MCCAQYEWDPKEKPNGKCPDCDEDTVDGVAYRQCSYAPVECETCNHRPCDGAC